MGQFVKKVRSKGKLYLYLTNEYYLNGKTVQKIIRRINEEEAEQLGWSSCKTSRLYNAVSTVVQLPLNEVSANHAHEETISIRVWGELENPKTTVRPRQVTLESAQIPAARFIVPIPAAAPRATILIAIDSSSAKSGLDLPAERKESNEIGCSPIPDKSKKDGTATEPL